MRGAPYGNIQFNQEKKNLPRKLVDDLCECLTELPGRILGCSDKYDVDGKQVAQSMPRPPLMVRE